MKRLIQILAGFLCLGLLMFLLCGCERKDSVSENTGISVFASFYPFYAAAQMVSENVPDVNLNCLVQPQDGCLRNYQLSDWDMALLKTSDMVIIGGRGMESFENLLYSMGENGPAVVPVLYNFELLQQNASNTQKDEQSHWMDPNPHIYMLPDTMAEISHRIAECMILLDPENETLYRENLKKANQKLENLESEIQALTAGVSGKKVIVMNEALVYSAQEYGLNADLCYERESGEDLYDEDLEACLDMLSKSDSKVVLIEKQAPQKLCNALTDAGYRLARLDVLSTRRADEGSKAYFDALRANAHAVINAFEGDSAASEGNLAGGIE